VSRLNTLLQEAKDRLSAIKTETWSLEGRVVIAYNEDDLLDLIKGLRSYPAVGVVFEGMRSMPEQGSTMKVGGSAEVVLAFVLIEQGTATFGTDQKRTRAVDYLEAMRDAFMTKRSTTTNHMWHFTVEAAASLKNGMVVWVQRWSVPIQLIPPVNART
jgi:hypothetical protein